jgi:hypothetical protein
MSSQQVVRIPEKQLACHYFYYFIYSSLSTLYTPAATVVHILGDDPYDKYPN